MTFMTIIITAIFFIAAISTVWFVIKIVKIDNIQSAKEDTERNMDVATVKAELGKFIREYGLDNEFETPAFILTEYIWNCLIVSKTK